MKKNSFITFFLLLSFSVYSKSFDFINLPLFKTKKEYVWIEALKKNKLIVVNFWASWCVACKQEIPELEALKEKYKNQKIDFVSVNAGESLTKIKRFLKKEKFSYKVLLDKKRKASKKWGVLTLPQTFVIGKSGTILYKEIVPPKNLKF